MDDPPEMEPGAEELPVMPVKILQVPSLRLGLVSDDEEASWEWPVILLKTVHESKKLVEKKLYEAFKVDCSAVQAANAEAQGKLTERVQALEQKPAASSSSTQPSASEQKQIDHLVKVDLEMRSIISNFASLIAVLCSGKDERDPLLQASHFIMDSMITQMDNVFKWDDERKRLIMQTLKTQKPFRDALDKLDRKAPE